LRLSRNKTNAITLGVAALVLFFLYALIRILLMIFSLQSAVGEVQNLKRAAQNQDLGAISLGLDKAADSLALADSSANDFIVQLFGFTPIIGRDIKAASVVSSGGRQVLQAAQEVTSVANQLIKSGIGKKPISGSPLIPSLRDGVGHLNKAIQQLNMDLSSVDETALHFGLDSRIKSVKEIVSSARLASLKLTPLVQVATTVIEQPGRKRWFISIQNLAELRGTGGITGAYAIVTSESGELNLEDYGSDKDLLQEGRINFKTYPVGLRNLWGVDLSDWRDVNASAHAPYAAQLFADGWQQNRGERIDGVLFIGQGVASQVSGAVGPIDVEGILIDSGNIVDFLAKGIYSRFPNVQDKDSFVGALTSQMFNRFIAGKISGSGLIAAAANDKTGDRIMAWSRDKSTQRVFTKHLVSGAVSKAFGPTVTVTLNNAGGNKLDAYTTVKADYFLGACNVDTFTGYQGRKSRVTINLSNNSPMSGLPAYVDTRLDSDFGEKRPKGSNRELLTIYGPVGSEAAGITVDGIETSVVTGTERNRPLWIVDLNMLPGSSKEIILNLVEPINNDNSEKLSGKPILLGPVMLNSPSLSSSSSGECSLR